MLNMKEYSCYVRQRVRSGSTAKIQKINSCGMPNNNYRSVQLQSSPIAKAQ